MKLIAYHNDPAVKEFYLARVRASRAADDIIHGSYGHAANSHWRGCAVGCTLHDPDGNHAAYETELGVPRILANLEDGIFESLPLARSLDWPLEFLQAIPVGADLSLVWPRFAVWMLADEHYGVVRFAKTNEQRAAIRRVAELYQRQVIGETVDIEDWRKAMAADADAADAARTSARIKQADKLLELMAAAPVPAMVPA